MTHVSNVNDNDFENEVLKDPLPVLVDFWAPWCGPCKAVAPVVEDLAKEFDGRLKVVKLNTDENPKTAQAYTIRGIPSLYLFKSGQVVEQIVGAVPKSTLATAINKHVG
ncbi:MAG: thioredoxin [Candidatus Obscuribacterales bacterium]|nr:thioredoxin [Candidatus Obscuribacterales bacterium]MBX9878387.1 thioredoxin [Candidatus Obscuribacterales bacterium]